MAYINNAQYAKMRNFAQVSSVSKDDLDNRMEEYLKVFSRVSDYQDSPYQKMFSGYAETPLLSTQYFNASVASFVSSFAGFMSIERDFDQPNGLFYWYDFLGISNLKNIIPNLGPDQIDSVQTLGSFTSNITVSATATYSQLIGRKLIPGSLRVKVKTATETFELIDNGQGEFMSVAGKLASSSIKYLNGMVDFVLGSALTGDADTESILIVGKEDTTGTPCNTNGADNSHANDKRFVAQMKQIMLNTVPDVLFAEYNIATLGAVKKATGSDMATFLFNKLRELYTKAINYRLVNTLEQGYVGDTMSDLDLTNATLTGVFMDYQSRLDLFDNYLIDVESAIATKAVKGIHTTAYLAGNRAANQFQKGHKFEANTKASYINDLLGWYRGLPVLRSTDVHEEDGEGTFYAICKTPDGQMAPLARGIYMPLTDTPTVGNYANPTQMVSGIYYQEGIRYMAPELVQKVTFKVGH